ncbi:MAG: hypothetical protein WCL71_01855, partial [Deltaproteobacteria bacterium]
MSEELWIVLRAQLVTHHSSLVTHHSSLFTLHSSLALRVKQVLSRCFRLDRVGARGLRPVSLPHHRT